MKGTTRRDREAELRATRVPANACRGRWPPCVCLTSRSTSLSPRRLYRGRWLRDALSTALHVQALVKQTVNPSLLTVPRDKRPELTAQLISDLRPANVS